MKHYGTPQFPHMVVSMSMGPVFVIAMAAVNAIKKWNDMIGPDKLICREWFLPISMRKRFGIQQDIPDSVHGSDTLPEAIKESRYFFADGK